MHALRRLSLLSLLAGLLLLPLAQARATSQGLSNEPPLVNQDDIDAGGLALWQIYNNIAGGMVVSSNEDLGPTATDNGFYVPGFERTGTGSNRVAILYARNADFSNTVGFYTDALGNDTTDLFMNVTGQGLADLGGIFPTVGLPDGDLGFFLDSPAGNWFSESRLDDPGTGFEHLAAYSFDDVVTILTDFGNGEGIEGTPLILTDALMLAWEDLGENDDSDYQDLVLVFGTIVPEPATALQLSLGLLGLAWLGRRSRRAL